MLSLHPFIPVTDIDRHSSGLSPNGPDPDPQLRMWCLIPGQLSRIADPRLVGGSIYMPLEVQQAMDEMNHPVYARQPHLYTDPSERVWLVPGFARGSATSEVLSDCALIFIFCNRDGPHTMYGLGLIFSCHISIFFLSAIDFDSQIFSGAPPFHYSIFRAGVELIGVNWQWQYQ